MQKKHEKYVVTPLMTLEELHFSSMCRVTEDYCATYTLENLTIGVCELQGGRQRQEDAVAVGFNEVQEFHQLSFEQQELALQVTFREMQDNYGQHKRVGSTACVVIPWKDANALHVISANLGDSAAYVVILNKDKEVQFCKRIHLLHNPSNPSESARILKAGGSIEDDGYLDGGIAVSRAFGDTKYECHGLSHVPDIRGFEWKRSEGDREFVIVACDGLETLSEKAIGHYIKLNCDKRPHEIANELAKEAIGKGSSDNVSVIVIPVSEQPMSAGVFDGHGGKKVAIEVSSNFYPTLGIYIKAVNDPAAFAKMQERIKQGITAREGLPSIKAQLEAQLQGMTTNQDFHVFIRNNEFSRCYDLIFATEEQCPVVREVALLAEKNGLGRLRFHSHASNDGHPKGYRTEISCKEGSYLLPENIVTFLDDVKAMLAKKITPSKSSVVYPTGSSVEFFSAPAALPATDEDKLATGLSIASVKVPNG